MKRALAGRRLDLFEGGSPQIAMLHDQKRDLVRWDHADRDRDTDIDANDSAGGRR
jgi:hypothetical protein